MEVWADQLKFSCLPCRCFKWFVFKANKWKKLSWEVVSVLNFFSSEGLWSFLHFPVLLFVCLFTFIVIFIMFSLPSFMSWYPVSPFGKHIWASRGQHGRITVIILYNLCWFWHHHVCTPLIWDVPAFPVSLSAWGLALSARGPCTYALASLSPL